MAAVATMAYPARDSYPNYPQHYAMYQTQTRAYNPPVGNPHTLTSTSQHQQQPHRHQHQQQHENPYQHANSRPSPASASPVSDDGFKPSLPSISNLLALSDRPASELSSQPTQTPTSQPREQAISFQTSPQTMFQMDSRPPVAYPNHEPSPSPKSIVPPVPAMRNDSMMDATNSPSTISSGSTSSGTPYYIGSALNNVEPAEQRTAPVRELKRQSVLSQPNTSPYGDPRYTTSPYATAPGTGAAPAYYSPQHPSYPASSAMYQQRPLPSNFPPAPPSLPGQSSTNLPTSNPWEHHHYISPSSQSTFPQSQDRYICPTCNKAFSRPSSLKIHSHSHTGEKPFRCPHSGCGKAFSVRSNMKRHERGCHSGLAAHHIPHAQMI